LGAAGGRCGGGLSPGVESSRYVDATLGRYLELRRRGHDPVATVLQSYLRRPPADLERPLTAAPRPTLRVVKGAYKESPDVALGSKREVADAFMALVARGPA